MVGGSRHGKECIVKAGDLSGKDAEKRPAGVRAVIVAQASRRKTDAGKAGTTEQSRVTTGGVKDGRKANSQWQRPSEEQSPRVPYATGWCKRL